MEDPTFESSPSATVLLPLGDLPYSKSTKNCSALARAGSARLPRGEAPGQAAAKEVSGAGWWCAAGSDPDLKYWGYIRGPEL